MTRNIRRIRVRCEHTMGFIFHNIQSKFKTTLIIPKGHYILLYLILCRFLQRAVVDADGCGQEGSPVAVCITADLKKPLTEDTLLLYNSLMRRMLRVLHNVLHFMKNPSLHNDLQRFQGVPRTESAFFISLLSFFKSHKAVHQLPVLR
ncbi:hypothetical protein XENORESO_012223 [Xenotaenia resolanae]|uniref:Uncharacterized protein n=1 Tax=Xenotaenia resolanae TaxID=208358 RepID=A0ABV0WEA2_9TELE